MNDQLQPKSDSKSFLKHAATGVAVISTVYIIAVGTLLAANYFQFKRADPLNTPKLAELIERFSFEPGNDNLKEDIRELDLLARRAFFASQVQVRRGSYLLLAGVIVLGLALGVLASVTAVIRRPGADEGTAGAWKTQMRGTIVVAIGGCAVLALALLIGILWRPGRPPAEAGKQPTTPKEHGKTVAGQPGEPSHRGPSNEEIEHNWPCFRGPYGNAIARGRNPPEKWNAATGENIRWKKAIPMHGYSSPVVWGSRVFVTGGDEKKREVYCFDADNGSILWTAEEKSIPGAPGKLPEVNENTGWAAPSVATDGRRVFAIFATGNLTCLDMNGKRIWAKHLGVPDISYAYASSLLVYEDKLIVQFDDRNDPRVLALDVLTGEVIWETRRKESSWASPIVARTAHGTQLILTDSVWVSGYDPAKGTELWTVKCLGLEVGPSSAYADGMVFACNEGAAASGIELTQAGGKPEARLKWQWNDAIPDVASPVAASNFVFFASGDGTFSCVGARNGQVVWQEDLKDGFSASPILLDDRIYALNKKGVMHIIKVADKYEPLGANPVGEECQATPAFTGNRIFIRTDNSLICVAPK